MLQIVKACKSMLNLDTFLSKCLERIDFCRTFALAFENNASLERQKKSSLKDLHNRVVVQEEASVLLLPMFIFMDVDV